MNVENNGYDFLGEYQSVLFFRLLKSHFEIIEIKWVKKSTSCENYSNNFMIFIEHNEFNDFKKHSGLPIW